MALRLRRPEPTRRPAPGGTSLDLGATAKALAADRAAATIHGRLGCGVLVSLGGDASAAGPAPAGGFAIGIADTCTSPAPAEAIAISSGGLASSGIGVRHWRLGAHQVHHIVDPATGLSAAPCWRTVSVAAATCVQANAASTAAMVLGSAPWTGWRTTGCRRGSCGSTGPSSTPTAGRSRDLPVRAGVEPR